MNCAARNLATYLQPRRTSEFPLTQLIPLVVSPLAYAPKSCRCSGFRCSRSRPNSAVLARELAVARSYARVQRRVARGEEMGWGALFIALVSVDNLTGQRVGALSSDFIRVLCATRPGSPGVFCGALLRSEECTLHTWDTMHTRRHDNLHHPRGIRNHSFLTRIPT